MKFDLANLDRRIIYILVIVVLSIPIVTGYTLKPSKLAVATRLYDLIENLQVQHPGKIAFVALDFGPNTKAENESQAEVTIEHLFRKRIPVAVFSLYPQAQDFLKTIPERVALRLMKEQPTEKWLYGMDWVNIGYKAGQDIFVQSLPKAQNIGEYLNKDAMGNKITDLPAFRGVKTFEDIAILAEFTGLVGMLDIYIQYFQKTGYTPPIVHGCTAITIPETYNYLDSGQLKGVLEGLAGAAWYSELLKEKNPQRALDTAALMNTALGIGHLLIIALVVLGNLVMIFGRKKAGQ